MPKLPVEWDDVEPGTYTAEIIESDIGQSSTGNPTWFVRMELNDGQIAFETFSLLPQAQWKVRKFLRIFGYDKRNEPGTEDLVGQKFEAIFTEDDSGRIRLSDFAASAKNKAAPKKAAGKKAPKKATGKKPSAKKFSL